MGSNNSHGQRWQRARRQAPRVDVETLCSEIIDGTERPSMVVDLSQTGIRVERPYRGGRTPRILQLEFELPGIDEVIWAKGETCFDHIRQVRGSLLRTTGIRLAAAARRDLRLLRDFIFETQRAQEVADSMESYLCFASAYARG